MKFNIHPDNPTSVITPKYTIHFVSVIPYSPPSDDSGTVSESIVLTFQLIDQFNNTTGNYSLSISNEDSDKAIQFFTDTFLSSSLTDITSFSVGLAYNSDEGRNQSAITLRSDSETKTYFTIYGVIYTAFDPNYDQILPPYLS
jgi:hypothetical protein